MTKPNENIAHISSPLLVQLDSRDAALWLAGEEQALDPEHADLLCRLPWSVVLSERSDDEFLARLEAPEPIDNPLVRRRGLIHLVDVDPAEAILPPRHLAVLLLNGRGMQRRTGIAALTRRLTMLQDLRRRSVRQLVVVVAGQFAVPSELDELWDDGYRTTVSFVSDDPAAAKAVQEWQRVHSATLVDLLQVSPARFSVDLSNEYLRGRDGGLVIRVRDENGVLRNVDAAGIDDPQRPVLGGYELIASDAVTPMLPSDLTAAEVDSFFADPATSWRPFAAGTAWQRNPEAWNAFRTRLRALDRRGAEENRILYVAAEAGAGATTFVRDIAWRAAAEGYPTFVAQRGPVTTNGLEMSSLLTRLVGSGTDQPEGSRLYEVPCVLVFDQNHWAGRETELLSFAREIERSGRRALIVVVIGPMVGLSILSERRFVELASLSHRVSSADALALGNHLNRYLAPHGTARSEREWRDFFDSTTVGSGEGIAAFWIVLSFWLQRQVDLGETVQSRVYRAFREHVTDTAMQVALLRIAAFSTVREPLSDELLPETTTWPVTDRIEDMRKELGILGLVRVRGEVERYWAMAHNLLGRFLLNGLFYDHPTREALGYSAAANPEHLRFLVLQEISIVPALQRASLRDVADEFAVSIFKIDPDHGHATFVPFWREVLEALDRMSHSVRTTSRTFLHHGAISRRRIASDPDTFIMSASERVSLLRRAAVDIEAALQLDPQPGGDTDINLYNSLAHALHDLAEAEAEAGLDHSIVDASRAAAQEATHKAYSLNPDNSFVVETYARALLADGVASSGVAATKALEVLTLVYSLMDRPASEPRRNALSRLAERAFEILAEQGGAVQADPETEVGAIAVALAHLGEGVARFQGVRLEDLPRANRSVAAAALAVPVLLGNVQAVKLRYMLSVIDAPLAFDTQLELLQSLDGAGPAFTPQMRLEMAVLLFQQDRSHEGDVLFRRLRSLWRRGEHFVEVPTRLHWLLDAARKERRQVRARVIAGSDGRSFARVTEFRDVEVPFRAAEFGLTRPAPGTALAGYVAFGHNGPLLRPLTAPRR